MNYLKIIYMLLINLFSGSILLAQPVSGKYDSELNLAFDTTRNLVTGYFEQYIGQDEETGNPRFSCVFYLEGFISGDSARIQSYFPLQKEEDLITGTLTFKSGEQLTLKLQEDHGGCWNVQPFRYEPIGFSPEKVTNWIQVRYISSPKAFFISSEVKSKELKQHHLVKGDIVYVEKIANDRVYCTFFSPQKTTKGWILLKDLNPL